MSVRNLQTMLWIFLRAQRWTELSIRLAWAACHCLVLHVYLTSSDFCGVGGRWWGEVYIFLFIFLCMFMVETKGRRWITITSGCSCLDSSLTCCGFFSFYYCAWNLKSSSECRRALAWVLRNSFRFGWELSCWKVLMEAVFVLLLIIISFPLTRDR